MMTQEQHDDWLKGKLSGTIEYPRRTTSLIDQINARDAIMPVLSVIWERYESFKRLEEALRDPMHLFYNH